jgi:hypothetical protein
MSDESRPAESWVGTNNGRGPNGLFAKGNRLATGNPLAKRHAEISKAIHEATSLEDVVEVWQGVIRDAKGGDEGARKIFFDRMMGRPSQALEITGLDADPVKIDMANLTQVILGALGSHPEARYAVAGALRQISIDRAQGANGGS